MRKLLTTISALALFAVMPAMADDDRREWKERRKAAQREWKEDRRDLRRQYRNDQYRYRSNDRDYRYDDDRYDNNPFNNNRYRNDARMQGHRPHDYNGDGVITRNEWPGSSQSFRQLDRDRDGVISQYDRSMNRGSDRRFNNYRYR